ncbi:Uma2 family endonuclease [Streptomyces albidoflavus]
MSVAYHHAGPWTVEEVLALPEDTTERTELVGGQLMMSPAPTVAHQLASHRLNALLMRAADDAGADVMILEAINVIVPDGLLIPDLAIVDAIAVRNAGLAIHAHDVLAVAEIASPSTRLTDRKLKPALYATASIEHYWRIDLDPAPRVTIGRRSAEAYEEQPPVLAGGRVRLDEPFPIDFDPASLTIR